MITSVNDWFEKQNISVQKNPKEVSCVCVFTCIIREYRGDEREYCGN